MRCIYKGQRQDNFVHSFNVRFIEFKNDEFHIPLRILVRSEFYEKT